MGIKTHQNWMKNIKVPPFSNHFISKTVTLWIFLKGIFIFFDFVCGLFIVYLFLNYFFYEFFTKIPLRKIHSVTVFDIKWFEKGGTCKFSATWYFRAKTSYILMRN
jgi:hypothetical protein